MALAFDGTPYSTDENFLVNGGAPRSNVFRVGDNAVLVTANHIAAYDDDGVVFAAREFADASGLGLGRFTTYHVHDNQDGTMNVYYQIRDADPLPTQITNWMIVLDAETGAETTPAAQITSGVFSRSNQGMLEDSWDLPNGNIAVIHAHPTFTSAELIITSPDGTPVGSGGHVVGANTFDLQQSYDLSIVGGRILLAWVETAAGAARNTFAQFFSMTGQPEGERIAVSDAESTGFGVPAAVRTETLSDGRVVVVWADASHSSTDTDGTSVWFKIYNADGTIARAATMVNTNTAGNQDHPILVATETGFIIGYSAFEIGSTNRHEGRLREYDNAGNLVDSHLTDAFLPSTEDFIRTDNNTALIINNQVTELILPGADTSLDTGPTPPLGDIVGTPNADTLTGTDGDDVIRGLAGTDILRGGLGNDSLFGGDGADTLNGGDGDDFIFGGDSSADLRDLVFAGAGNDSIDAGYGNDEVFGQGGNDTIAGGFGSDTLQGQDGNDVLTGSALSDLVFGNAGDDFVNGGFGHDRINGGAGADRFFHLGILDHGSDFIQDYNAAEGDRLLFGVAGATRSQFQININDAVAPDGEKAGDDNVQEAFVIYRPTGQIMWALIDGAGQSSINLQLGSDVFDLLA